MTTSTTTPVSGISFWRFEVRPRHGMPDPHGAGILRDLRGFGFESVESVSGSRLYLLSAACGKQDASRIAEELLGDALTEEVVISREGEPIQEPTDGVAVEVHYRPGVMDPVAASARVALRDMGIEAAWVRTARRYVLSPKPPEEELRRIVRFLGNDCIEEVFVGAAPVAAPPAPPRPPFAVRCVAIRDLSDPELARLSREGHLFLSLEEMRAIRAAFAEMGRDPSDLELETLAQTWSEHCVHKTLTSEVVYRGPAMSWGEQGGGADGTTEIRYANLLRDTIGRATEELMLEGRGPKCLSVFKDNAGVIAFDERYGIAFKVETHNHPSAIEPYGGAATGLGGCIRDVIGCGRGAQPIAATDVFCLAPPDWPVDGLPAGVLHPRQVLHGVVAGVRDYGNRMGIPTVNGAIHFDPRYLANPLVFCGCVGLIPRDRISKGARPGDSIVLVGGRTGRDGIHGATFSSAALSGTHADEFAHAVQIGNPIEEKRFLDVLMQARDYAEGGNAPRCLYSAITDCGAGGLSSAVGEMGAHCGVEVDLECVPLKYAGLRYDEIWISESQERMVLAVPPENMAALMQLCGREDVEATMIGRFTETGRLVVRYEGVVVGDLPMRLLHEERPRRVREAAWRRSEPGCPQPGGDVAAELRRRLSDPTVASKEWVVRQYDHEVRGGTIIKPMIGPHGDGPGDAAVILPRLSGKRAIALGCGLCPQRSDDDPYWMAMSAIDEAIRNVVCVGGDPDRTAILDNFCWGSTDDAAELGGLVRACQACYDGAKVYGTPFISGKDSLNNEFELPPGDDAGLRALLARYGCKGGVRDGRLRIPGTLLVSAVSLVEDVGRCMTMDLKQERGRLYLIGHTENFDPELSARTHRAVARLIREKIVTAVHDVSDGGVLVACAEMCLAGRRSCRTRTDAVDVYFVDHAGLYVVETEAEPPGSPQRFTESLASFALDLPVRWLAEVEAPPPGREAILSIALPGGEQVTVSMTEVLRWWSSQEQ
jgi:phosphoribosylformylglycinamidine synthase II